MDTKSGQQGEERRKEWVLSVWCCKKCLLWSRGPKCYQYLSLLTTLTKHLLSQVRPLLLTLFVHHYSSSRLFTLCLPFRRPYVNAEFNRDVKGPIKPFPIFIQTVRSTVASVSIVSSMPQMWCTFEWPDRIGLQAPLVAWQVEGFQ